MKNPIVEIDGSRITDWDSFHDVFATAFGFPEFYGRNMDAWIDCLTSLDEAMNRVQVEPGRVVVIHINHLEKFAEHCPEQYAALVECSAFVNWRRIEQGEEPVIALSFYE